jgi:hypothetical protein
VDDAGGVRRSHGIGDLPHNGDDLISGQRSLSLRVFLEDFPGGPFDRKEVQARRRLANFYGAYHVWVCYSCAERCFANKTSDRRLILTQSLTKHLHGHGPVRGMLRPVDSGGSPLADEGLKGVTCDLGSDQRFLRHGAILTFEPVPNKHDRPPNYGVAIRYGAYDS